MTIREEYEDLKLELTVRMQDASVISILDYPFECYPTNEEEDRYFVPGSQVRLQTKKALILLDNSYNKSRLFPGDDTADLLVEAFNDIYNDYRKNVLEAFLSEPFFFADVRLDEFEKFIDKFISDLKEASKPYIEKVRTTTQREIEMEVRARDNYKKMNNESQFDFNPVRRFGNR